ncbi:DUF7154 domain-containing protein [Caenorhabditis elegans]|uniref:DUF7154 domain-containing protein n=1 Tax=Caenorhabditis elegans TaxID=6239 RepID=A4F317_CAEEL|nr:CUB_2 domain-containing protein [Caenorhabditis elegans]CCD63956.1 CUB_2 domain-containing protein [Caenorhabditis elegans]|eukprot:NP_741311.1 Uncharacterized protein CELE_F38A1.13 [Caenorhabditis elegans]
MELPSMNVPFSRYCWVTLTIQDHLPIDSFRSLNLSITNDNYSGGDLKAYPADFNGILAGNWFTFSPVTYSMKLQYNYTNGAEEATRVRVYCKSPLPYWLPYCG